LTVSAPRGAVILNAYRGHGRTRPRQGVLT